MEGSRDREHGDYAEGQEREHEERDEGSFAEGQADEEHPHGRHGDYAEGQEREHDETPREGSFGDEERR